MNGLDRCLASFVPVPFIGSSGGGIAQVVHRSAVEQVVTLTAGVTKVCSVVFYLSNLSINPFMFGIILNRYLSSMGMRML